MAASVPLIYAVRHGITDWNVEERLQGAQDIPLNQNGRKQATNYGHALNAQIGERLDAFDFVSSPLRRTRETMELLRQAMDLDPAAYRTENRLIEISFGDWESYTLDEIAVSAPEKVEERKKDKWDFQPPGKNAESYEILSWRVAAWLNEVKGPTVCVCHGGVMRVMFYLIAGIPPHEAAELPTPQDKLLKIEGTDMEWLPVKQ